MTKEIRELLTILLQREVRSSTRYLLINSCYQGQEGSFGWRWELDDNRSYPGQDLPLYQFPCIDFRALMHAAESDFMEAIGNWRLKVGLEDPSSAECVNKMMMTAKYTVKAMICIAALKEGVVNQIMTAINFEEVKTRAVVVILRSESRVAQLSGIMEKGKAQERKSMGMTA
jgi:hypothetical protein